jgi:type IV pilus assembly protein PilB
MTKLGESLIHAGLITREDLQAALAEQRRTGERIGAVLVRLNLVSERQITRTLGLQLGLPYVGLSDAPPKHSAVVLIPRDVALTRICVAVSFHNNVLTVAAADPLDSSLADDLQSLTGHPVRLVVATTTDILDAIASGYRVPAGISAGPASRRSAAMAVVDAGVPSGTIEPIVSLPDSSPVATSPEAVNAVVETVVDGTAIDNLLALIVNRAATSGATDIHIDPCEHGVLVRHRIDGILTEPLDLPHSAHEALASRIKELARIDAGDTPLPRDGRMRLVAATEADYRVFTSRTVFGEKVVLRAFGLRKAPLPLEEIGFSASALQIVRDLVHRSHGMILVAGPSISGKTTTLASLAGAIKVESRSVVSLEEWLEYRIPGVNHTQCGDAQDLQIEAGLAAILNHDPDVLMIADVGSRATATLALQAARTRQLVLTTLHADNVASAISRLGEIAANSYVTASALIGVIAQRLVRRLCLGCRRQYTPDTETLRALSIPETSASEMVFFHGVGCDACHHTGYKGRIALFEVLRVTDNVRRLIAHQTVPDLLREAAIEAGMVPIGEDGLGKVKAGITTANELLRVIAEVREVRTACPECAAAVAGDFKVCPRCGHRLSGGCHKCGRALQSDWEYCPYCAATAHKKKKKSKDHKSQELPGSNVAEFKNR